MFAIDTGSCQLSNDQFKSAIHPKNWFNYTGFVKKLENIRIGLTLTQFMIHFISCYATNLNVCPICIKNRFLVT